MYLWVMGAVNLKISDFYFMFIINILQIYIKVKIIISYISSTIYTYF